MSLNCLDEPILKCLHVVVIEFRSTSSSEFSEQNAIRLAKKAIQDRVYLLFVWRGRGICRYLLDKFTLKSVFAYYWYDMTLEQAQNMGVLIKSIEGHYRILPGD